MSILYTNSETQPSKWQMRKSYNEYVHRVRDITTDTVYSEIIERHQFPVMADVLDELESITSGILDS